MNGSAGTLTIGPTGSIKTVAGLGGGAAIGNASSGAMTLVNQGLISAAANFNTLFVRPANLTNTGTIGVKSGSTLTLVGAASWSNTGTIRVEGGTLNMDGTLTTAALNLPGFVRTGGTVNLIGTLDNNGGILSFADHFNVNFGAAIIGGTINTSGAARLFLNGGRLQGVTLAGVASVNSTSFARGGLTLSGGQVIVNANSRLTFQAGNQALSGNGTVVFAGNGGSLEVEANRQLTIGPGVTFVATTGTNRLIASASGASGVIDSTISTAPGATVLLVGNWTDRSTRIVPSGASGGGPLPLSALAPGNISVVGEQDNWTYFARTGQALSIILNPISGISPALGCGQVQIVGPDNNVIGAAAAVANGQSVQLLGFTFPSDGSYTIRVQACPSDPSAVGNYLLSAHEATPNTRPLVLNQQVTGVLESRFSTDRWTFSAAANQQVQFRLLAAASPAIRFQLTGPNGFVGFTDLSTNSGLVNLPTTGEYVLQASGNVTGLGGYTMRLDATSQTALTLGTIYNGSLSGSGFVQLFKVDVTQASPLLIRFDDATDTDRTEVYARLGSPPTRQTFAVRFDATGADHQLAIPLAAPGTWYVLVYGDHVPVASNFTLLAEAPPIVALGMSPNFGGVGDRLAPTITGLGFVPGTQFDLVPVGGGAPIPAERVSIDSTTQAAATFDLTGAALGNYDVRVTLPTGPSHTLPGAFEVGALAGSNFQARLIMPGQLGRHVAATFYLEYENTGTMPLAAPILIVQSGDLDDRPWLTLDQSRVTAGFWTSAIPDGFAHSVQIYASGASPGVLQPGERIRVPVYYAGLEQPWDLDDLIVELKLRVHVAGDTTTIDWSSLENELRPDWIAAEVWPAVFGNLTSQIGATWGDYVRVLNNNALYLDRLGVPVSRVEQLYGFELQQAIGIDLPGTIAAAVDAFAESPGMPLTFDRSFGNTITERYRVGPLGRGWYSSWFQFVETLTDGTVIVHESADVQRRFQPDIRAANAYFSQTGDAATLRKLAGEAYELTETNGFVTKFLADGRLDLVRDAYGNTITAAYTNNRLTSLTHSSGKSLAITYNTAGRIASVTDPFGRATTFGYDATNGLLLTATSPAGADTYTYSTGNGAAREYALTAVTDPSGVTQSFEYDPRGRLTATFFGANERRTSYAYDEAGGVTISDAANVFTTIFFDHNRQVARVEDNTGNYVRTQYDVNYRPLTQTDAQGATQSSTWTNTGAVRTLTDELGHTTTFTPGGPLNQPLSFSDARGSITRYTYNTTGGVTATTYADSSVERATYDVQGNLDVLTNRRGQTNDHTVNASGQVTRESRSDGTVVDYTYDASGRLHTATDASGTTTLSYDAADRLTRVEYPNGRWLHYTYDEAGRRTRLEDHTGFVVQYVFDAAGRMERLLDAANALVVRYTYDTADRLSREDKGNGTYTVYGYDLAGRVAGITHRAPDNSINAAFGYTYDAVGRRVGATTPDGTWTYTYDLTDQLIRAEFASTSAGIANQDLAYEYDALGNRVRTIINGVTTNYTTNSLNQYTAAGTTTFSYDLDGNLIQENGPVDVKTYAYDLQNRLKSVQTAQGLWQYEYDVLGNRSAAIVDGQRTEYLIDPIGLGNVVGEYNGTGTRTSAYAHGLGLEGSRSTSGWGYYDFDAIGSTAGITSGAGTYVNRYAYEPFGTTMVSNESRANPFEFVGEFGVMTEGNGLNFMRARYYLPDTGRFANQDPIRLAGGDFNLYRYVSNNPANNIDPSGLDGGSKIDLTTCYELQGLLVGPADRDPNRPNYCVLNEPPESCEELGGKPVTSDKCAFVCEGEGCIPPPFAPPPTPPSPPCDPGDKSCNAKPPVPQAVDPNEKLGASGFGPDAYIPADTLIPYRINFENLGPGSVPTPAQPATAPAQRVEVTDQLSAHLDWNTLEFTEFGFGDTLVTVPAGRANHFDTLSMAYNNKTFDVQIELTFDSATGLVTAVYQSLDPLTALPPEVLTGFLPPEDGTGIGKAHFSYTIQPKAGLPSGTELRNVALIRFDRQTSIATNQVDPQDPSKGADLAREALNTIDAGPPSSMVASFPATGTSATFTVNWFGQDDHGGSGVAAHDIYVSIDGSAPALWLDDTTETSALYTGAFNHTYAFYSIATDNVGHVEDPPTVPDAQISIASSNDPPVLGASDDKSIAEGTELSFQFTATDPNTGDALTYSLDPGAPAGAAIVPGTGVFSWTPDDGPASYSVTLRVRDNGTPPREDVATFTIHVLGVGPTATLQNSGPVVEGSTAVVSLANQFDPSAADTAAGFSYSFDFDNDGTFEVTNSLVASATVPAQYLTDGPGSRTVKVRTIDKDGDFTDFTTIITIENAPPVMTADSANIAADEGQLALNSGTWTDAGLDAVVLSASVGNVTINADGTWSWSWLASDGPVDGQLVTVSATDSDGDASTVSFQLTVNNLAPTAENNSYSMAQGAALSGNVITDNSGGLGTDSDPAGASDPLTISSHTWPANGTLLLNPNGSFSYTPSGPFLGIDSFSYNISDGDGGLATAVVTINVSSANPTIVPGAVLKDGVLRIVGTPHADLVGITRLFGQIIVAASFLPGGLRLFPASGIQRIDARLHAGNDRMVVAGNVGAIAILDGGAGDDVIYGGGGASIILGGPGDDLLIGGPGRHVVIGGTGADTLLGSAASDLLIAGTTAYDKNDAALQLLLKEWTSSQNYNDRVANLREGVGPVLAHTGTKLKKGITVFDDSDVDELYGGTELDWLLFDVARDRARDKKSAEVVN
jgi:RHS repeat-associated protein